MRFQTTLLPLTGLLTLTSAHFDLLQPPSRGSNHDKSTQYPCSGLPPSKNRTQVALSGPEISIALKMGHDRSAVQVLLALGSDPGTNFNITLVPTFGQTGLGDFCLPTVKISEKTLGRKLSEGLEATLQVVTNGDPSGGLYNCADIVFTSKVTASAPSNSCKNGTGVSATDFSGSARSRNANESTANGQPQRSGSGDGNQKKPKGAAASVQAATWGVFGAAILGAAALL
ncbi:uncharacterized protein PADG_04649 [Paracoccidioides brasiliensis Pb18]|uniref:Copper acquisition factor BIM1-like domain-containing protein n=2 Tax=Paracoccidioides brasiliensis TaxID=121759 RepID=C1GCC7_PARBD|nr:uncharacterized protein PADG_04649 [Paracoccidioides brasiliensis Pb18]EEH48570.1 hypothetical protein PADG_04649 [Paracoccidioides brasiliensis Pb18]ODH14567.1 hypothetical protein ACO22_06557 [Paracoccidioides brasiliensis]ODH47145.1 hypothetical protein GX48_06740 [Paracoccidioides brasiliensis]